MSETIREKAIKAWAQEAPIQVDTTKESYGCPFDGVITSWDMEKIILRYDTVNAGKSTYSHRGIHWQQIVDIRFLDEDEAPVTNDVAKQVWEIERTAGRRYIRWVVGGSSYTLADFLDIDCTTDEQVEVMAAAPEMLDVLVAHRKGISFSEWNRRKEAVIKKARGGVK